MHFFDAILMNYKREVDFYITNEFLLFIYIRNRFSCIFEMKNIFDFSMVGFINFGEKCTNYSTFLIFFRFLTCFNSAFQNVINISINFFKWFLFFSTPNFWVDISHSRVNLIGIYNHFSFKWAHNLVTP